MPGMGRGISTARTILPVGRPPENRESPATSLAPPAPRIESSTLIVPPFCLRHRHRRYLLTTTLRIDLRPLDPDDYRVLAVQSFWIEDDNPDLSERLAGIFLARRRTDGGWEEPESWPVECRTLAVLGRLDTRTETFDPSPP